MDVRQLIVTLQAAVRGPFASDRMGAVEGLQELLRQGLVDRLTPTQVAYQKIKSLLVYYAWMGPDFLEEDLERYTELFQAEFRQLSVTCQEKFSEVRGKTYMEMAVRERPYIYIAEKMEDEAVEVRLMMVTEIAKKLIDNATADEFIPDLRAGTPGVP